MYQLRDFFWGKCWIAINRFNCFSKPSTSHYDSYIDVPVMKSRKLYSLKKDLQLFITWWLLYSFAIQLLDLHISNNNVLLLYTLNQ